MEKKEMNHQKNCNVCRYDKYDVHDLICHIMKKEIDLPLVEFQKYINVGMCGLLFDNIPIATNGIATCMGIGTHIDGLNYFSHASPFDYSGASKQYSLIFEWKELLEKNVGHINYIYLYTPYGLVEESLPFLDILNDLKLIDKTIHVRTTVYNEKNKNYTSEWNDEFKVGISEKGPWGFDFSK